MAALGLVVLPVGVGDHPQVGQDLSQPGWVETTGGLQQDWFGLDDGVVR
jgi:hypothetical protein